MAIEDFTTYTEVEPGTKITIGSDQVSHVLVARNEESYVYKDMGAAYFGGDFIHYLTIYYADSAQGAGGQYAPWVLANTVNDIREIVLTGANDALYVVMGHTNIPDENRINLVELSGGTMYAPTPAYYAISLDTPYYLTLVRDESVGTHGTFYCFVYSDAARTTLLHTFTITLHDSKKDFRYIYPFSNWKTTTGGYTHSGFSLNLDLSPTGTAPTVTASAVTAITGTTATGNGNVTSLGVPPATEHGVCWAATLNPTTAGSHTTDGVPGSTGAFTSSITGLTPGNYYYVRAYVTNSAGTAYSGNYGFRAETPAAPTVTTQIPITIRETTATGKGTITALNNSAVIEHGHCWGTSSNPTIAGDKTTLGAGVLGSFESSLTGLTGGTTYHIRAYATNGVDTGYGSDVTFITPATGTPVVTTQECLDVTATTATGHGKIVSEGSSTVIQYGHCWDTSVNPDTTDSKTTKGIGRYGIFTSAITGLASGTLYYVRAYATNTQGTAYGDNVTVLAGVDVVPTVSTKMSTSVTETTATGNGVINSLGDSAVTEHGHCWNTSGAPDTNDDKTTNGAGTLGAFTSSITGLLTGTTYYVRAYATNTSGTGYGEVILLKGDLDDPISESVFPERHGLRISSIIYRYDRGVYNTEMSIGSLTSEFLVPEASTGVEKSYNPNLRESAEELAKRMAEGVVEESLRSRRVVAGDIGTVRGGLGVTAVDMLRKQEQEINMLIELKKLKETSSTLGISTIGKRTLLRKIKALKEEVGK